MAHFSITKGLDIPIKGAPQGALIRDNVPSGQASSLATPERIALSYADFPNLKLHLLAKPGDRITIGQAIAEDKKTPGRFFVAPAAGILKEEIRGTKRALLAQVIELDKNAQESHHSITNFSLTSATREELIAFLLHYGGFTHIRQRPFNLLADPKKAPRSIFVKGLESAPFVPPPELQVSGYEEDFHEGLLALKKLTNGPVHLICREESTLLDLAPKEILTHTISGPHPIANSSLHIHLIDPINTPSDVVWTLSALDTAIIGGLIRRSTYRTERVVSIAGPAIIPSQVGYYKLRQGYPIDNLIIGRVDKGPVRLVSGDPLTGRQVQTGGYLGFNDTTFTAIKEEQKRSFLHFFRLGLAKYSFSRAYLTGHLDNSEREYEFTTSQHGEHRAFIDGSLLDKVMPMRIPTMLLIKAIISGNFDLAEEYGLLEVDGEDFALSSFVDPSKTEMVSIVKQGLLEYAQQVQ